MTTLTLPELTTLTLPDLGYAYEALVPVLSAEALETHHDKHHATYVKTANELLAKLADPKEQDESSNLKRSLAFNVSGHVLHSLFWKSMSPDPQAQPGTGLTSAISAAFGSTKRLQSLLSSAVEGLEGSGWAALLYEPASGRLIVSQLHDHQNASVVGAEPLLVIDGWEHAYYLDYRSERKKWASAFWEIADWTHASERFDALT